MEMTLAKLLMNLLLNSCQWHQDNWVVYKKTIAIGRLFPRATNFVDFVDFGTFTKIVSLKISRNSIMTWIAD